MTDCNYLDLKNNVWNVGLCTGCSICATVCPMKTIYFDGDRLMASVHCKNEKDCVPCGACVSCCPRIDTYKDKHGLGTVISAMAVRATIPVSKKQSGGAITAIVYNAVKRGLIDAVVTVGQDHATLQTYSTAISDPERIVTYAGTKYVWYTPPLLALRSIIEQGTARKVAVIGTPCVIQALRKMLESDNEVLTRFKSHIALLIGVFCTEIFDYATTMAVLAERGVSPGDIRRMDIKKDIIVETYDGREETIPITERLHRPGCDACLDFAAVDADISAGSIGSDEGYTTILTRTHTGEFYLHSALENGCAEGVPLESTKLIETFAQRKYRKNAKGT